MNRVTGLAVATGVLAALLVKFAPVLSIGPIAAVIGFAVYFAAGGKVGGLLKALASMLAGVAWQLLANMLLVTYESALGPYRWVLFGLVAFAIVLQSRIVVLSSIPGGLCGAAMTAHASVLRPDGILVGTALIVGAVAGFLADATAGMISKKA
jgi:hypothetical protein